MLFQPLYNQIRFATKKSGGSTSNGRTSRPKYLGFKKPNYSSVTTGNIIVKQRGTQWYPGFNVGLSKDHSIYALAPGKVILHYDLETQKRYISVDDGSLPHLHSKPHLKQKVIDQVDMVKYLSMDGKQRYDYVMEIVSRISQNEKQVDKNQTKEILAMGKTRRFDLTDLTRI